jgi:hypothetical protein
VSAAQRPLDLGEMTISGGSLFGDAMDALARQTGGWPEDAVAYAVEVLGKGDDPQVMLTGEVPVGTKGDGSPKFGSKQTKYRAVVALREYRAALAKASK